ncbi:MAG: alkaline phosphatase family protein [Planctomycetia bacterium]|nr:alkaline phosphatase family protein [Planctomycetia bacterium]
MTLSGIAEVVCTGHSYWFLPAYIGPGAGMAFLGSFLVLLTALGLALLSLLTWPFRSVALWLKRLKRGVRPKVRRVVVVGLDGLDPGRVRSLMAAGRLPNFRELADRGTFADLGTTLPPISPVAWSSFMTGVNPGKHNIFDFLNRDLRTYCPELSSARVTTGGRWNILASLGMGPGPVRLLRKSQPFWKVLGEHGIFSTILRVPITFPPERFFGLSLSAMCTPDLRGTQGSYTLYSTDASECAGSQGGLRVHVTCAGNRIKSRLSGPPNLPGRTPSDLDVPLTVDVDVPKGRATLRICGQTIGLKAGEYTDWVRLTFRAGLFQSVRGICRFRLEQLAPHVRIYVTPVNIDPERPALPISHPLYYSIYLAKLHESFATLGLAEDTWGLNTGAIDEGAFLEQAYSIHAEREAMFFEALRRTREGLCACVFDASDRIQHMFYRFTTPDHPCRPAPEEARHAGVIDAMYERMDELVGRVRKAIGPETVLLVLSDHGFCDFSRAVHLNAWLRNEGYLVLEPGSLGDDYLAGVDWSRTRAYAFGLAGIYINQARRESQGIVAEGDEAANLRDEIAGKLRGLSDPQRGGRSAIRKVYDSRTCYTGPYAQNGPDLVVGYQPGYRASWDTAVGRTAGETLSDNTRRWSGDHCVDPSAVPGVLFCNRKLQPAECSIVDLAPTILDLFGVAPPAYMDGKVLRFENDEIRKPNV